MRAAKGDADEMLLRFIVPESVSAKRFSDVLKRISPPIEVSQGKEERHALLYEDTASLALFRKGTSLQRSKNARRRGRADGVRLETPARCAYGNMSAMEVVVQDADAANDGVPDKLRSLLGGQTHAPILSAVVWSREFMLTTGESSGVLRLMTVAPSDGNGVQLEGLQVVEVEPRELPSQDVEHTIGKLLKELGLRPVGVPLYSTLLVRLGIINAISGQPVDEETTKSMPVRRVAASIIRKQFEKMVSHESGVRCGKDPEDVHDMRVAIRRLRAAIKVFAAYLPESFESIRQELRWIGRLLGEVRDLDVQLAQLDEWRDRFSDEQRSALGTVVTALRVRRGRARGRLVHALNSSRYSTLVEAFTRAISLSFAEDGQSSSESVVAIAPDVVRKRYRAFHKAGKRVKHDSSPERYHRARIRAKQLRYMLEFLSPLYGEPAVSMADRLSTLQDVLGTNQDSYTARETLHDIMRDRRRKIAPAAQTMITEIERLYQLQSDKQRKRFPCVYKRSRGKTWKAVRKAL